MHNIIYILLCLLIFLIISFLIIYIIIYFKTINVDINKNMKINFLKIRNINNLILKLPYEKNYVDLKNNLPIQIVIGNSKIKGYGIVANKDFKKNEVIYIYPMKRYPKNGITIKTKLGERKLDKNIHFDVLFNYFNLCAAFDCFLNQSYSC